jgi:hypothetical protein
MKTHHEEYVAPTRHGDPDTSFEAAEKISGNRMTAAMLDVLRVLQAYQDRSLSDEELCVHYHSLGMMRQTDQSIRSRRAQLHRLGYVGEVGFTINRNGNRCRTWKISFKGIERLYEENDR